MRLVVVARVVRSEGRLTGLRILAHEFVRPASAPRTWSIDGVIPLERSAVA